MQDLIYLRKINLFSCKNLKKIPNLLKAVNLERLDCRNCENLVELPSLAHLTSLKTLHLRGCRSLNKFPEIPNNFSSFERLDCENCENLVELPSLAHLTSLKTLHLKGCRSLNKFPDIPNNFDELDLSETGIEEVPDLIEHLDRLERLSLRNSRVKNISSRISKLESLLYMDMDRCKSLNLLSELPPNLHWFDVHDCTSLENVSFADQNLYQFDSLDDETVFCMLFCNCFDLNQESINNIEANAMLKLGSLAQTWAAEWAADWVSFDQSFICCFPGNEISAKKFKCQSENSFLSLKIAPNGGSGSRFLVFAICIVANLTYCPAFKHLECICEYQLTGAGGGHEKLRSKIHVSSLPEPEKFMGDHVFILSSIGMVHEDKNYEEASFEFKIRYLVSDEGDYEEERYEGGGLLMFKRIEVERCGVHVFYVDAASDTDDTDGTDDTDATEKRHAGNKRSFSHDGEEGDGGLKRLK